MNLDQGHARLKEAGSQRASIGQSLKRQSTQWKLHTWSEGLVEAEKEDMEEDEEDLQCGKIDMQSYVDKDELDEFIKLSKPEHMDLVQAAKKR